MCSVYIQFLIILEKKSFILVFYRFQHDRYEIKVISHLDYVIPCCSTTKLVHEGLDSDELSHGTTIAPLDSHDVCHRHEDIWGDQLRNADKGRVLKSPAGLNLFWTYWGWMFILQGTFKNYSHLSWLRFMEKNEWHF